MYCDSAYFFEQTNSLEAFSNVRMEQGDTLFVYGNYLFYDGNTQIAYLRENVRMENGQVTLFTDSLNYERIPDIGYYFDGGLIVDSLNQLSSFYGQYSPSTKLAIFNDSVRLENEQFTLYSDTLHYNTDSKIATILGPSIIVSDSGTIYSSRGWYDTVNNTSLLLDRSQVVSGDRILTGDSIAYNRELGVSQVVIPARLSEEKLDEVKTYAAMAYTALNCEGLARCDFFVEHGTNRVMINEINTFPGFTPISMYPKLMEHEGTPVPALIDHLIELALERTEKQHG